MDNVIVSQDSFDNTLDPSDIIASNISFLNVLSEEGFEGKFCHEAEISYYLDYYTDQLKKGGFSLFVYNSGWNDELIALIQEGLANIQAPQQLAFFNKQLVKKPYQFKSTNYRANVWSYRATIRESY